MSSPFRSVSQSVSKAEIYGINLTGLERTWDSPKLKIREFKREINELSKRGVSVVRIPLAFDYLYASDRRFLRKIDKLVAFSSSKEMELVFAYFGHELTEDNLEQQTQTILSNWLAFVDVLPAHRTNIYLELLNEPTISPSSWGKTALKLIEAIRRKNPHIPIIVGATNANSMFELSRMQPFPFEKLIYTFHYYEPYVFTHQGTPWTGDQHATLGVPYPFDEEKMPLIHPKALGSAGEVNLRDYYLTGNTIAVEDKISQIAAWAERYQVVLWCTEFGATVNADQSSRINYINDVSEMLNKYGIPGFIWEWKGNFGVDEILINP